MADKKKKYDGYVMSIETAVHNIERYVMVLRDGKVPTKAMTDRYYWALGYLKGVGNLARFGEYTSIGVKDEANKKHEALYGANITPISEVLKERRQA